ncbi:MAG: T9SS type A sorting domain-containing protein [Melioribacteraceae bacterium]|nr:MAG: T9SS type A sorting domain-containing protein [Melioribacteraceae bacterium]
MNHLPRRATIRIFNLAGHLVRTLHKDSDSQFYLWDLQNEHQVLAASGLYILHIEMPDLGKVKILKLAIVLGTEVPDFY